MKKEEVNSIDDEKSAVDATPEETAPVDDTAVTEPAPAAADDSGSEAEVPQMTSEEFDAENAPKKTNKLIDWAKRTAKWKLALIGVAAVLLIIIIVALCIIVPLILYKEVRYTASSEIEGYVRVDTYIANNSYSEDGKKVVKTMDIKSLFKDATSAVVKSGDALSISGTTVTASDSTGKVTVTVTENGKETDYVITVVKGINVYDDQQLDKAVKSSKYDSIVLQKNINLSSKLKNNDRVAFKLDKNLYGNTFKIDATGFTKDYEKFKPDGYKNAWTTDEVFRVEADNVEINGVHILGKDLKIDEREDKDWSHNEYADGGALITVNDKKGIVVKNCVLEKSFKSIFMYDAEVRVEGNLMREVADGNISMQTTNTKANKLHLKNNVMINPQVAAIICFSLETKNPKPAEITIEGFLDVYNWKNSNTAALMPITEGTLANIVNGLIGDNLDKRDYKNMMVQSGKDKAGKDMYWLHIAIVVLASGHADVNEPIINGDKMINNKTEQTIKKVSGEDGFVKRQLPFGAFQGALGSFGITTANMIGYKTMPKTEDLKPKDPNEIKTNADLFKKIYGIK